MSLRDFGALVLVCLVWASNNIVSKYVVSGLRDPMANDPVNLLPEASLEKDDVIFHWDAYQAANPAFIVRRAGLLLQPPQDMSFTFSDGVLTAHGSASHDWIVQARRLAGVLPGVVRLGEDSLVDIDSALQEIAAVREQIEQRSVRFATGSSEITPDQQPELNTVMALIRRLALLSESRKTPAVVEVLGHADQTGTQDINDRLIVARADQVVSALVAIGAERAFVVSGDPKASGNFVEYTRKVTFKVNIASATSPTK